MFSLLSSPLLILLLLLLLLKQTLLLASFRTNHKMTRTTSNAARSNEHEEQPNVGGQEIEDQLSREKFNAELNNDVEFMLTQEESGEEQGGQVGLEEQPGKEQGGEVGREDTGEGSSEESSASDEGYESPEDENPPEYRHKTREMLEEELDKDFDPNEEEVGI